MTNEVEPLENTSKREIQAQEHEKAPSLYLLHGDVQQGGFQLPSKEVYHGGLHLLSKSSSKGNELM
jgi:hypothetical protein